MAITLRHDAAAVVPPSNQTTRKYGQQLVLQQQQQKYAAQQAGYGRMFDAYKQQTQNQFQFGRDQFQNEMAFRKENRDNQFLTEQQQRQQQAADFKAARGRMDAYAKESLNNPDLPHELRQRIQNLISGKLTALGGGFDGPAQQEFLDQYNAQLAALLSEVPPPKAKPTRDEALREFLGDGYDQYGHLPWAPDGKGGFAVSKEASTAMLQQQKEQQQQQELQQQEMEQMRPKSFEDYYNHADNKGQFKKDLDSTMAQLEGAWDPTSKEPKPTKQDALLKMQEDYDFQQKALGRPQYGEPTVAGPKDPGAAPQAIPTERSILEQGDLPQPDMSQLENPLPSEYTTGAPAATSPTPAEQNQWSDMASGRRTYDPPYREVPPPASQPEAPSQPTAAQPAGSAAPAPDFNALSGSAKNNTDRAVVDGMKGIYSQQPPQVQSAIAVYLDPNSSEQAFTTALKTLLANGIDPQQMQPPIKGHWDAMNDTNKSLSGVR